MFVCLFVCMQVHLDHGGVHHAVLPRPSPSRCLSLGHLQEDHQEVFHPLWTWTHASRYKIGRFRLLSPTGLKLCFSRPAYTKKVKFYSMTKFTPWCKFVHRAVLPCPGLSLHLSLGHIQEDHQDVHHIWTLTHSSRYWYKMEDLTLDCSVPDWPFMCYLRHLAQLVACFLCQSAQDTSLYRIPTLPHQDSSPKYWYWSLWVVLLVGQFRDFSRKGPSCARCKNTHPGGGGGADAAFWPDKPLPPSKKVITFCQNKLTSNPPPPKPQICTTQHALIQWYKDVWVQILIRFHSLFAFHKAPFLGF